MAKRDMQTSQTSGNKSAGSTQSFLDVSEVREGTVILRDGSLRAVVVVSATNFSLKSQEEQAALVGSYQSFLNSLEFPIQILMQSRKLDINSYLDKMRGIMQQQTNELLRLQTQEYIEYVAKLIEFASIMNKTFYVVVPYSVEIIKTSFIGKLGSLFNPASTIKMNNETFDKNRGLLYQRVDQVAGELSAMGLRTIILNTEELVELLYNSYNLNSSTPLKIKSIDDLEVVKAREEGK